MREKRLGGKLPKTYRSFKLFYVFQIFSKTEIQQRYLKRHGDDYKSEISKIVILGLRGHCSIVHMCMTFEAIAPVKTNINEYFAYL